MCAVDQTPSVACRPQINGKQQKDLHRFILEAPAEESKGKGSQVLHLYIVVGHSPVLETGHS